MSFKSEVIADSNGKWAGNGLTFPTRKEAAAYVQDLAYRWTSVRDVRVVKSEEPAGYRWVDGRIKPIEAV